MVSFNTISVNTIIFIGMCIIAFSVVIYNFVTYALGKITERSESAIIFSRFKWYNWFSLVNLVVVAAIVVWQGVSHGVDFVFLSIWERVVASLIFLDIILWIDIFELLLYKRDFDDDECSLDDYVLAKQRFIRTVKGNSIYYMIVLGILWSPLFLL